jgi:uncharacterized protein YndB with AHSA1/START domain
MAEHLTPVRRQIVVPVTPDVAFTAFTRDVGAWWPTGTHSVYRDRSAVAFDEGQLVEESPAGRSVWGSVLDWTPGQRLRMTWHAGGDPATATEVSVRFDGIGDGSRTLVTLEHIGWERLRAPFEARGEYAIGWVEVLDGFVTYLTAPDPDRARHIAGKADNSDGDEIWLALTYTPGPDAPADRDVFTDPRLRGHFEFLSGLRDGGVLVAAGPVEGRVGQGMTVIRVPAGAVSGHVQRVQFDDRSVVSGLLDVDVAIWSVKLAAG